MILQWTFHSDLQATLLYWPGPLKTYVYPLKILNSYHEFFQVLSLNFDPFYANDKDVFHLQTFHADYTTVRFQENILTLGTAKLNKV